MADITGKEFEAMLKAANTTKKVTSDLTKEFDKFNKAASKAFKDASKRATDFTSEVESAQHELNSAADALKELSMTKGFDIKNFEAPLDNLRKMQNELEGLQEGLEKSLKTGGPLDLDKIKDQSKGIAEVTKRIADQRVVMEAMKQSSADAYGAMGEGLSSASSMMSAFSSKSPAALKKSTGAAAEMASKLKLSADGWAKQGGAMKAVGAGAKVLGGTLGGMSKLLGGPVGMIAMMVKGVWDLGMAADKVVKTANKSFAMIRGPDLMTSDVKGQFSEFNKQIYNTARNWEDGVDVGKIREFAGALYQSGKAITDLNVGFKDYRSVIHVAAKASATLGADIVQIGSMMGVMMTDMKADLDNVDRTFNQVAFDAKKAGLSTDRFWNTVQNASASLSTYGLITGAVSKALRGLTDTGTVGAQEAQSDIEGMYDSIKNGSLEAHSALLDIVGTGNVREMFKDVIKGFEKSKKDIEIKLGNTKDEKEREQLQNELYVIGAKIDRARKASTGDATVMASEMGFLAESAPELLTRVIGKIGDSTDISKISGDRLNVINKALETVGFSPKLGKDFIDNAKTTKKAIEDSIGVLNKNAKGNENIKNAVNSLGTAMDSGKEDDQIKATEKLKEQLEKSGGVNKVQADYLGNLAKTSSSARQIMSNLFSNNVKTRTEASLQMTALLDNGKVMQGLQIEQYQKSEKTAIAMDKAAEGTLSKIVDQTLSYEDMQNIAKDEIKYRASALGYAQKLNDIVFSIFKGLSKMPFFSGGDTEGVKSAKEKVKSLGGWADNPKEQARRTAKGMAHTNKLIEALETPAEKQNESQKKLIKDSGMTLEQAKAQYKKQEEMTFALQEIDSGTKDIVDVFIRTQDPAKIGEMIAADIEAGASWADTKEKYGSSADIGKYLAAAGKKGATGIQTLTKSGQLSDSDYRGLERGYKPEVKATMSRPEIVTSPGVVKLDPGETIYPKGNNFKTVPADKITASQGAGSGSKNISITVNATERDLAQKIANEIRSVMYNEKVTGMA